MSIEPVTVTTKHNTPVFDLDDHQNLAAQQMGLEPDDIHCVGAGPDEGVMVKKPLLSDDGTLLRGAEYAYTRRTTWAEKPRAPAAIPETVPIPEEHPWPAFPNLHRGQRWHGLVTIEGVTAERHFIHDGTELVLLSSPDGKKVLDALNAELVADQLPTGG